MKKSLFLLLGLAFIPNVSFGYSYYSYFSSTSISLTVNTVTFVLPQSTKMCYNDDAFDSMGNYIKYLDDYEATQAIYKLDNVNQQLRNLNNGNYYTTERVGTTRNYYGGASYTSYSNQQVFNTNAYNSAIQNVCNAQQELITYVTEKYNEKVKQFNERLNRIRTNLQNGDDYANKGDYNNAIKYYNAAIPDIEKMNGFGDIITNIKETVVALKEKGEAEEALKNYQELSEKYKKALLAGKDEYYDAAIKDLEDIIKNEGKIEWDYYDEAKESLAMFKKGKELYRQAKYGEEKQAEYEAQVEKNTELENAKKALGNKAAIFEGLVPIFKQKDEATQTKVKTLLKTFESSKDSYTRNIGIYFGYLIQ